MTNYNDTFSVLTGGGVDSLDGIAVATISDDDFAFGMVNGLYHPYTYDASISKASTESPYYIVPADNSSGTGAWVLGGFQGAFSHVEAKTAVGQSIPDNTSTTIIFGTEVDDDLGEYVHTTGIFTAIYAGKYLINSNILFSSAAWTSANVARTELLKDGVIYRYGDRSPIPDTENQYVESSISTTIKLAAGENIRINILQNSGGARTLLTDDKYNWLTIDRIS